jgi:hypothetical protein
MFILWEYLDSYQHSDLTMRRVMESYLYPTGTDLAGLALAQR